MQLRRVLAWCVQGPGFNPQHQERQRHNYSVLFPFETILLCCPGCPPASATRVLGLQACATAAGCTGLLSAGFPPLNFPCTPANLFH